jgi:hypothetical protein
MDTTGFWHNPVYHEYLQSNPAARAAAAAGRLREFEAGNGFVAGGLDGQGVVHAEPIFDRWALEEMNAPRILLEQHDKLAAAMRQIITLDLEINRMSDVERNGRMPRLQYLSKNITKQEMGHRVYMIQQTLSRAIGLRKHYDVYIKKATGIFNKLSEAIGPDEEELSPQAANSALSRLILAGIKLDRVLMNAPRSRAHAHAQAVRGPRPRPQPQPQQLQH